jgi:hypothetical protein
MLLRMCPSLLPATDACAFCCCCSVSAAVVVAVVVESNLVDSFDAPPRRSRFLRDVSNEAERRTNDEVRHHRGWRLLPDRVSDEDDGDDRSRAAASGYRLRDDKKNWRRGCWICCSLVPDATQFFFMAAASMCGKKLGVRFVDELGVQKRGRSEYTNADAVGRCPTVIRCGKQSFDCALDKQGTVQYNVAPTTNN